MDHLCLAFVNSERHDYLGGERVEDRLELPSWREQFLTTWNLQVQLPLDSTQLASLRILRTWLRSAIEARVSGRPFSLLDLEVANRYLGMVSLTRQTIIVDSSYRTLLFPLQKDWKWVQGEIVSSFMEVISHSDPSRLKQCSNPSCRWIYYDESKNQSRSWCDETCANLIRVRRARARKVVIPGDTPSSNPPRV